MRAESKNLGVPPLRAPDGLPQGRRDALSYLILAGALFALYLISFRRYLLFHSLVEIFSVIISCGVFMFSWNSRRFMDNNYLVFIGVACLFIAFLDTLHTLAYQGMGVFPGHGSNLATQLWVQARFIQSVSFAAAPFFLGRRVKAGFVFLGFTALTAVLLAGLFYWKVFPVCYVPGRGLTPFKISCEYAVAAILLAALVFLVQKKSFFEPRIFGLLAASIVSTVLSELAFSHYVSIHGEFNLIGHFLKVVAFYFLYKATIETGLSRPYDLLLRDLKRSEQRFLAQRDRAQTYLDVASVMMVVIGRDQTVTLINKKGCEILGDGADGIVGKNWFDEFVTPDIREEARAVFRELVAGRVEPTEYFENTVLTRDGETRLIAWHNSLLTDGEGKVTGTISSGNDITAYRRFHQTLKDNEELFRTAVDNYPSIFVIYDKQRRIKFMNSYGLRIYGMPKENVLGRRCEEVHPPHMALTFLPALRRTFETGTVHTVECPLRFPTGSFVFVMTYVPMLDERGEIKQVLGISYDVTERKLAENALKKIRGELEVLVAKRTAELREANEILEKIFSSTHFSLVYLDIHFNFVRVNKAYADACGHPVGYFTGKNHFDLYPDAENEKIFETVIRTGEPFSVSAKPFEFPDHPEWGTTYWDWSLLPVREPSGRIEGLVFCLVDVTKRKQAEEELSRTRQRLDEAQRLSDIGTLAATVAHELRNPLASIHVTAFNMLRKANNPELRKYFDLIEKRIEESDQIINNLLFYSRIRPPKYQRVELAPVIEECLSVARSRYAQGSGRIKEHIDLAGPLEIDGDPVQLREVFGNIINNAYDALWNREGTVSVEAAVSGPRLSVSVKDTGPGMDDGVLENVFNPFFTTKSKGTGLGLTVSKQIIDLHGGRIEVSTKKDRGTAFTIILPVKTETS